MTTEFAIRHAVRAFRKAIEDKGDIRSIDFLEGIGQSNDWQSVTFRIKYVVDGDSTESDKNPFCIRVFHWSDGAIVTDRINYASD